MKITEKARQIDVIFSCFVQEEDKVGPLTSKLKDIK